VGGIDTVIGGECESCGKILLVIVKKCLTLLGEMNQGKKDEDRFEDQHQVFSGIQPVLSS
jgi:hypothetical protein